MERGTPAGRPSGPPCTTCFTPAAPPPPEALAPDHQPPPHVHWVPTEGVRPFGHQELGGIPGRERPLAADEEVTRGPGGEHESWEDENQGSPATAADGER